MEERKRTAVPASAEQRELVFEKNWRGMMAPSPSTSGAEGPREGGGTIYKRRAKKRWSEKENIGESEKEGERKRKRDGGKKRREKSNSDRDGAPKPQSGKRGFERGTATREERRTRRYEREWESDIERERKREGESGRTRERRRAAACPAEGARRPHMCSETNVRSECRLLPIIRCRGVPLCARGWSADSVPRFYAARQPGPVRARGYPRKPRAKSIANSTVNKTVCGARVSDLTLTPRVGLKGVEAVRFGR
ncbi:hypothetical protein ALC62_09392 [Cyphomyrmex costatus]|uniref:Uncharacterized protein n=1 Tax=Cyphomyrmex costatus TaxID=456900 RepID=A0A195CGA5_9HYME|nr:hypothetical protein ALC62_09392 [Cyphomyrmex costatus]